MVPRIRVQTPPPPVKPRAQRGADTIRRAFNNGKSYDVGYRKPPKAGQFRRGASGNKNGRPRGAKNIATLLIEALREQVTVIENGSPRRMSKLELMFEQLADQGAGGDLRAVAMVLQRFDAAQNRVETERTDGLDESDQEVAQALITRIRNAPSEPSHD